jgi:hypothetical protein
MQSNFAHDGPSKRERDEEPPADSGSHAQLLDEGGPSSSSCSFVDVCGRHRTLPPSVVVPRHGAEEGGGFSAENPSSKVSLSREALATLRSRVVSALHERNCEALGSVLEESSLNGVDLSQVLGGGDLSMLEMVRQELTGLFSHAVHTRTSLVQQAIAGVQPPLPHPHANKFEVELQRREWAQRMARQQEQEQHQHSSFFESAFLIQSQQQTQSVEVSTFDNTDLGGDASILENSLVALFGEVDGDDDFSEW